MNKVNLSVPATIMNFSENDAFKVDNAFVTPAKAKLFYVGKTDDNRVFTEEFSEQLLKTLPFTPIVSYYDGDDFQGHAWEQNVYGFVPQLAKVEYVEENGVKFAITDVILFTGREDNIGHIASQISGKQLSIEIDPNTVSYEIVTKSGQINSITFQEGSFIGISVLGDYQKPGFTGAEFFTTIKNACEKSEKYKQFIQSFNNLMEENNSQEEGGGVKDVIDLDQNNEEVVPTEEVTKPTENIEEKVEVEVNNEVIEDPTSEEFQTDQGGDDEGQQEDEEEVIIDSDPSNEEEDTKFEELETKLQDAQKELDLKNAEFNELQIEMEKIKAEAAKDKEELNEFRNEVKRKIISSYSEFLTKEEEEKFLSEISKYSKEDLEKELSFISMKKIKEQKENSKKLESSFSTMRVYNSNNDVDSTQALVDKYKDK